MNQGNTSRAMVIVLVLCIAGWAGHVQAQTKPEPKPEPARGTPLPLLPDSVLRPANAPGEDTTGTDPHVRYPKFDVPEYTITGEDSRRLNQAQRPSFVGDGENAGARSAGLGRRDRSVLAGDPKNPIYDSQTAPFSAGLRAGYGSFRTPSFDGWIGQGFSTADVMLSAGFRSGGGHAPNADYQRGRNTLSGGVELAGTRVAGSFSMDGSGYRAYGSNRPEQWRMVTSIAGDAEVRSIRIGAVRITPGLHMRGTSFEDPVKSQETQLGFDFGVHADAGRLAILGNASFWSSAYTAAMPVNSPYLITAGAKVRTAVTEVVDIEGGLTAGSERGTDRGSKGWVDVHFGLFWRPALGVTTYLRFDPSVQRASLWGILEENPYLVNAPHLRNRRTTTHLVAGMDYRPDPGLRLGALLRYDRIKDMPIFVNKDSTGFWTPSYADRVSVFAIEGNLSLDISDQDMLNVSLVIRRMRDTATERSVPYKPDLELDFQSVHRFPFGLRLIPSLRLVGSRYVDPENTRALPTYLDIGLRAEYIVVPSLRLSFSLGNIFDADRTWWEGYAGIPRTAEFGVEYIW